MKRTVFNGSDCEAIEITSENQNQNKHLKDGEYNRVIHLMCDVKRNVWMCTHNIKQHKKSELRPFSFVIWRLCYCCCLVYLLVQTHLERLAAKIWMRKHTHRWFMKVNALKLDLIMLFAQIGLVHFGLIFYQEKFRWVTPNEVTQFCGRLCWRWKKCTHFHEIYTSFWVF